MRRLLPLVSVVVVVLAASLASGRLAPDTAAQDATPTARRRWGRTETLRLVRKTGFTPNITAVRITPGGVILP